MLALYFDNTEHSVNYLTDYPLPQPTADEALIKVSLAAVCSTDKEIIKGYKPDFCGVLGHEFVGVVEQATNRALLGKRVVGELNAGCGTCLYCKSGREKHCLQRKVIGIAGKDGCFAQYLTLRQDLLHVVPDKLSDEQAVHVEPLAAAFSVTELAHIRPSQQIALIGDGRLAYLIGQVLALTGAEVTVYGKHPQKLAAFAPFAKITPSPGQSFLTVVDASGSPEGFGLARTLVQKGGLLILKSTYAGEYPNNLSDLVVNEITVKGSRCGPFAPALRLLERGLITLPPLRLYPLCQWREAFAAKEFKVAFDFRQEV